MRSCDKIFYAWLIWIFWLPLPLGSNRSWSLFLALGILFVLAAVLVRGLSTGKIRRKPEMSPIIVPLIIWVIWLLFGLFQLVPLPDAMLQALSPVAEQIWLQTDATGKITVNEWVSVEQWFWSLGLLVNFLITWTLVNSRKRIRLLITTVVAVGVLQALYGSLMTMSGLEWSFLVKKISGTGVATGTFVNRNHFAGFVVLCLSLGLGRLVGKLDLSSKQRLWKQRIRDWAKLALSDKIRLRFYLAVMVIGLVMSHSRMGNASFFIAMLVTGILALYLFRPLPKPLLVLIMSLVIIDISILGAWFGVDRVVERIQQSGQIDHQTGLRRDQARLDVDEYSLNALADFPVFGSGGGSYQTIFPFYRQHDVYQYYDHAHNDYLEFSIEYGIPATLMMGWMVLMALFNAFKAQRLRKNRTLQGLGFGVSMAIIAGMIHAFVDFNLHIPAYSFYFSMILALAWVALHLGRKRNA
ncbi:MAG: O-antigen ligase family protein [bacterium]